VGSKLAAKVAELALQVVKDATLCSARITINNLLFNSLFNHFASFYFFFNRYTLHYFAGSFVSNFLRYAYGVLFGLNFGYAFLNANLNFDLLLNLFANLNVYLGWYAFGNLFHLGYFAFFPNLVGNPALNSLGLGAHAVSHLVSQQSSFLNLPKRPFKRSVMLGPQGTSLHSQ